MDRGAWQAHSTGLQRVGHDLAISSSSIWVWVQDFFFFAMMKKGSLMLDSLRIPKF